MGDEEDLIKQDIAEQVVEKKTEEPKQHTESAKKTIKKVHAKKSVEKKEVKKTASKSSHKKVNKDSKKDSNKSKGKKSKKDDTLVWKILGIIVGIAIIIAIVMFAVKSGNQTSNTVSGTIVAKTGLSITADNSGINEKSVIVGAKDAPITVYVYSEYLCPYCKKFHDETLGQIIEKYVKTGYVKVVPKEFVVHGEPAKILSVAALCANEQGKYAEMDKQLFSDQYFPLNDKTKLTEIATAISLDVVKFDECVASGKFDEVIAQDMTDGQALGVSGTPAISVNGYLIVGAQPFSVFDQAIQDLIAGKEPTGAEPKAVPVDTSKDPESTMYVISDKTCTICDTTQIVTVTKEKIFPKVNVVELDYKSTQGAKILKATGSKIIPIYAFSNDVKLSANYASIEQAMIEAGDYIYINPGATGGQGKLLVPVEMGNAPVKGNAKAKVTIVEFSDFECPYCGKFYSETYNQIVTDYIDTGKVRIAFRNFPLSFHKDAQKAAEASECAKDQNKFWEMHDKLFESQSALDVASLKIYAKDLSLDTAKFNACLDNGDKESVVAEDAAYGASIGVSGTPAFYINGMQIAGALPFESFKEIIDAELAKS
ncbi:MAG: thioredoxin domain-containing protein [Candidatus Woesearchaeota archaeon]|jgi:protein-disulfide isomerase